MSTYDQHDIKAILNRAAELQQRSSGSDSISESNEHLTLSEIEEIARDAGVSPDFVREAALEYEGIPVEKPLFIDTGDYNKLELIGFAKGKLDKKTWAELRSIIEYHFDSPGKVIRRPDGIQWKAQPKGILKFLESRKSPEVEIETENQRTSIRIRKSLKTVNKFYLPSIASLLTAFFILSATMMGEMGNDVGAGLIIFGLFIALAELLRKWVKRKKNKRRDQLQDLMQQLQTIVTRRFKASKEQTENRERPEIFTDIPDAEHNSKDEINPKGSANRIKN